MSNKTDPPIILDDGPPPIQYPRKWKNKEMGQIMRVAPWWEMIEPDVILSGKMYDEASKKKRTFKIGALVQCGWLLCNEHDVYFGVGMGVETIFEDLGYWPVEQKEKANEQTP